MIVFVPDQFLRVRMDEGVGIEAVSCGSAGGGKASGIAVQGVARLRKLGPPAVTVEVDEAYFMTVAVLVDEIASDLSGGR